MQAFSESELRAMEDSIVRHKGLLIELMDPDFGLLDNLLANERIQKRAFDTIKLGPSTVQDRCERLISHVLENNKVMELMSTLKSTNQVHLVNYIHADGKYRSEFNLDWPLDGDERKTMNVNRPKLIEMIDNLSLCSYLVSEDVINARQHNFILSKSSDSEKNEALLEVMYRFGQRQFLSCLTGLRKTCQGHVADILSKSGAVVGVRASLQEASPNVDERDEAIVSKITDILENSDLSLEDWKRLSPLIELRILTASKGNSVLLYFHCLTFEELQRLAGLTVEGSLKKIVEEVFTQLLNSESTIAVSLRWSEGDFERTSSYFANRDSKASVRRKLEQKVQEMELEKEDLLMPQKDLEVRLVTKEDEKSSGIFLCKLPSMDLLEELNLRDYYPQKLSVSEAIKLGGDSKNGWRKQYGLEIVRKILVFDSAAVVSVTTELNKRLNHTINEKTKEQCRSNVRLSCKIGKAEPTERELHPMDILVVVMNCCDDFLRQALVEKLFANKRSIPILLPDVKNGPETLLLLALRSLVLEVPYQIREDSTSLTDTLVDVKNPILSFIRVGDLHRSKSKLVNELLNLGSFDTFFHGDCSNGSAKRSVSNGSIEAAWFQSLTAPEEEFNCRLFTALNLRGDARDCPKQTQFLCQSSTLIVFMVDSFESFEGFYERFLENFGLSQIHFMVCYVSPNSPDKVDDKYFKFLEKLVASGELYEVIYDWHHETKKMSDDAFTIDMRKAIFNFFKPERRRLKQISTYANVIQSAKNCGFLLDEDKFEYKIGKMSADQFIDLVLKQPSNCKPIILPLQGDPWKKIGRLERQQRGQSQNKNQDEYFIAEKETEKRRQREIQCRSLIQQNEAAHSFSTAFYSLHDQTLLYYLNSCKIELNARSRGVIAHIIEEYKKVKQENRPQLLNEDPDVRQLQIELQLTDSAIGLEHILRELGQMYEAVISEEIRMKEKLQNASLTPDVIRDFPVIVAKLLLMGHPLELMDGDASNVPITWLKAILHQLTILTANARVFVLSIIGIRSSGKSTLLNALFGLQFPVSAGRCTRGIYCHLVPIDKGSLRTEYDYILVVDTEGLGASEFAGKSTFRDNELATFAIGLADAAIINMKGENWAPMKDILQIVACGLIRIRKTKEELELMPRCMFVHHNVSAADAKDKNLLGQDRQLSLLDAAIKAAGRAEGFGGITKFSQVVKYYPESHSWYFPDLWNGSPPKARISQDYIGTANQLRQYLLHLMTTNPTKLTISSFFLRMSDLWNAMLHNDFVLCLRNA